MPEQKYRVQSKPVGGSKWLTQMTTTDPDQAHKKIASLHTALDRRILEGDQVTLILPGGQGVQP